MYIIYIEYILYVLYIEYSLLNVNDVCGKYFCRHRYYS